MVMVTILVVEDEDPIRAIFTEILEDEGYSVVGVRNGMEALVYLRQYALPQLILLDLSMPVMNGWQFREEQQRDSALAKIPVIITSALSDMNQKLAALNACDCLRKPIAIDSLLSKVAQCCQ